MGHSSTEMLFLVYSRYVPDITRQDGSAMDNLLIASQERVASTFIDEGHDDESDHSKDGDCSTTATENQAVTYEND